MATYRKKFNKSNPEVNNEDLQNEIQELRIKLKEKDRIQKRKEDRREREYRMKYLSFINCIVDSVFIYDAITYKFLHFNAAALDNYGFTKEELLEMTPFDLHLPEDFEKVRKNIDKSSGRDFNTYTHVTKDRKQRIVEISSMDIYFDGKPAWMSVVHDITERTTMEEELQKYRFRLEEMVNERTIEVLLANKQLKQEVQERIKAEIAILESEKKFRNIIEKSRDGIILIDEKGSIIEWNSGQEIIYGSKRGMVVGKKVWDVLFQHEPKEKRVDENYKRIKEIWEDFFRTGNNPFKSDLHVSRIERPDGELRDIQRLFFTIDTDHGVMMACSTRDITDRLILERQLIQTQKMEAMGTLAGGIAHDFNNVLSGIIGYTDLAIRKTDENSETQKYFQQILTASRRATRLIKQILTFSRNEIKEKKEPVQLAMIVKEALKLLNSTLPETIEVISKIDVKDCFIYADSTQIHQVIMNLCTNAAHAMKDKGGILEVKITKEFIEDGIYKELKPGEHLRLTVSDTGHGIKQELMGKIFDPFFTTKKLGEGTGMGLSVVHGIIEGHNGHISVFSKEGEGTMFSILLPIIVDVIHKYEEREGNIIGGNERILLIEDDTYLIEAEKKMLEEIGYHVNASTSAKEALELFKKVPSRFDIIITDFAMPKMTGIQFIRKIRPLNPDIPVIVCTGFQKMLNIQRASNLNIGEIILKPIELSSFANSIRCILDKKKDSKQTKAK